MNIKLLFAGILFLYVSLVAEAQVTIGSSIPPNAGALLDLKEETPSTAGGATASKGLALPRVKLVSATIPTGGNLAQTIFDTDPSDVWDKDEHIGLTVYNVGGCSSGVNTGMYTWNGTAWDPLFEIPNTSIAYDGSRMQDSLALVAIYDATNGDEWINNNNWKTDKPMNEWHGVTLTADQCETRVTKLDLSRDPLTNSYGNNMDGDIPAAIGDLSRLIYLNFSYNKGLRSVTIGDEKLNVLEYFGMDEIDDLESFTVGNNSLNALTELYMYSSSKMNTFTIGDKSLNSLLNFFNPVAYTVAHNLSIGNESLNSIENFAYPGILTFDDDDDDRGERTLSIGSGSLTNATTARISMPDITEPLKVLSIGDGSFANTEDFTLSHTTLDDIPVAIENLANLRRVYLNDNNFENLSIEFPNSKQSLEYLGITSNSSLKTLIISSLNAMKTFTLESPILETLTISDGSLNALTNLGMNGTVSSLKDISIGNNCLNTLTGYYLTGGAIKNVTIRSNTLSNLANFYLTNSALETLSGIENLSSLKVLDLHNNKLVGNIPIGINSITTLTRIDLRNNQLSGFVPDNIRAISPASEIQICPQYQVGSTTEFNPTPWTNFICPPMP